MHGFFRGILPPLCTVNIIKTVSVGVYEKSRVDLPALTRGWMRGETPAVYFW